MREEKPVRVVIAEDDYLVAEEIKRTLRASRYEIVGEAANGAQAMELVGETRPDVVLMDIKMPQMGGLEASIHIQQQWPTPIVILTAHESKDLLERASEAGAAAYLIKPPNLAEIDRAVTIALARHHDLMELRRLNGDLKKALHEIKLLHGILPLCSFCKKIRDEAGEWQRLEAYIHQHSEAEVSHTICPDCVREHYPEYNGPCGFD